MAWCPILFLQGIQLTQYGDVLIHFGIIFRHGFRFIIANDSRIRPCERWNSWYGPNVIWRILHRSFCHIIQSFHLGNVYVLKTILSLLLKVLNFHVIHDILIVLLAVSIENIKVLINNYYSLLLWIYFTISIAILLIVVFKDLHVWLCILSSSAPTILWG